MKKNDGLLNKKLRCFISVGQASELSDALKLAKRVLIKNFGIFSEIDHRFSEELFIAMSLTMAVEDQNITFEKLLDRLTTFVWGSPKEIFDYFLTRHRHLEFKQSTCEWFKTWSRWAGDIYQPDDLQRVFHDVTDHWRSSCLDQMVTDINKKKVRGEVRNVQIFDSQKLQEAISSMDRLSVEKANGARQILDQAICNNGFRKVPVFRKAYKQLEHTACQFENLKEPIERLRIDLTLASEMPLNDFYVKPVLLLGEPGIGKTYLATQIASALGVDMIKISSGGLDGGFQLCGSHSTWTSAQQGLMFDLLARSEYSTPVVVLDEVDKLTQGRTAPVLPVLLDLLEQRTAREFSDVFLNMNFDCSKCIFILTANYIEDVPPALLSRVNVFEIPKPDREQRFRIIQQEIDQLQRKTRRRQIQYIESDCRSLAERVDLDLRKTMDIVREGFARAISLKSTHARIRIPESKARSIGFGIC
jgi:ATP-dependent Lon protease